MHQWSKLADVRWLTLHEKLLQSRARGRMVIISRPGRERVQLEIICASRNRACKLREEFGGRVERWQRDWLKRFETLQKSKPLKIGNRLLISTTAASRAKRDSPRVTHQTPRGPSSPAPRGTAHSGPPDPHQSMRLVIPASAAFGTGHHATTAMALRLIEHLSRKWQNGWSLADLGTGSGILALAAKSFGAGRVIGLDNDPKAISIAKANARLNKIDKVDFQLGDVRRWNSGLKWDVIAANLYSELLIGVVSKIKRTNWLILSGVLRTQEGELLRVLHRNNIEIVSVKRRGKWIAVSAHCGKQRIAPTRPFKKQKFAL